MHWLIQCCAYQLHSVIHCEDFKATRQKRSLQCTAERERFIGEHERVRVDRGTWWLIGKFDAFSPKGRGFESHSSRT